MKSFETDGVDRAAPVRAGEGLDLERLAGYLEREHPDLAGELAVEQFPSGYSNLTYLVTVQRDGEASVEMVVRRPPMGSRVKTAHDMGREYRVLAALQGIYAKAPRPLFHCQDPAVLGGPFYAMERRRGIILRGAGRALDGGLMRDIAESLVSTLVELHAVDYRAAGLGDFGRPEGYVARQVAGWAKRWDGSRTGSIREMDRVGRWLLGHQPAESAATLIHNDFKYDNLVLAANDPARVIAVLDWEMATLGDPLMDLGTTLGYWTDPDDAPALRELALSPTAWPGNLSRLEVAELYASLSGRDVEDLVFYYVFGLFKIAVIVQQIYFRFSRGLTEDPRFARLGDGVRALAVTAGQAVDCGRVDRLFRDR